MQQGKSRHLSWRHGEASADQHQRDAAARRERSKRGKIRHHKVRPGKAEDLVPSREYPAHRLAIGKPRRRQGVIQGRRRRRGACPAGSWSTDQGGTAVISAKTC